MFAFAFTIKFDKNVLPVTTRFPPIIVLELTDRLDSKNAFPVTVRVLPITEFPVAFKLEVVKIFPTTINSCS